MDENVSKNKFEDLNAWEEAHKLVIMIYKITKTFPAEEKFRLIDQICRSSSSVAANLVEGGARAYRKEYLQFAYQSRGSLEETKHHLLLAKDLNYLNLSQYNKILSQANVAGKLINGLITYLRTKTQDQRPNL